MENTTIIEDPRVDFCGVAFFARDRECVGCILIGFIFSLESEKVRLRVHVSCDLPDDHRVCLILPEANQAVVGVYWPWVILEFENVGDWRGSE